MSFLSSLEHAPWVNQAPPCKVQAEIMHTCLLMRPTFHYNNSHCCTFDCADFKQSPPQEDFAQNAAGMPVGLSSGWSALSTKGVWYLSDNKLGGGWCVSHEEIWVSADVCEWVYSEAAEPHKDKLWTLLRAIVPKFLEVNCESQPSSCLAGSAESGSDSCGLAAHKLTEAFLWLLASAAREAATMGTTVTPVTGCSFSLSADTLTSHVGSSWPVAGWLALGVVKREEKCQNTSFKRQVALRKPLGECFWRVSCFLAQGSEWHTRQDANQGRRSDVLRQEHVRKKWQEAKARGSQVTIGVQACCFSRSSNSNNNNNQKRILAKRKKFLQQ